MAEAEAVDMAAAHARCTRLPALNAAKRQKCLSSPRKAGRSTAETATKSTEGSSFLASDRSSRTQRLADALVVRKREQASACSLNNI